MTELYVRNFEYFLRHGVDCDAQDTVIVVGREYHAAYLPWVTRLNRECGRGRGGGGGTTGGTGGGIGHNNGAVVLVSRRSVCYDMEAAHLVLGGGYRGSGTQCRRRRTSDSCSSTAA